MNTLTQCVNYIKGKQIVHKQQRYCFTEEGFNREIQFVIIVIFFSIRKEHKICLGLS